MSFRAPKSEELVAVQRLKDRLAKADPPVQHVFTNTALLRFYRGRKGDEDDAYKALLRHVQWRNENDVNNIHNDVHKFQKEMDAKKVVAEGYDTSGRPAVFIYTKNHNKNDRNLEHLQMLIIYTVECVLKKASPDEERILICFDLTGFKLSNMDYDMVTMIIRTMEFNYPETLNNSLIINAPFMFYACWAVIQPWLDPVTASKVSFVSADKLHEIITFETPDRLRLDNTSDTVSCFSDSLHDEPSILTNSSKKTTAEVNSDFDAIFNQNYDIYGNNICAEVVSPVGKPGKRSWW